MSTSLSASLVSVCILVFFAAPIARAQSNVRDLAVEQAADVPAPAAEPLRVGVAGLVHGHVGWILGREDRGDIEIVGIAEPNRELSRRYADRYGFSPDLFYDSVEEMIEAADPEALTVFTSIYDHLRVTETAARHGVHVMVEKPLAFSNDHARRMKAAADSAGIHLLTNYETTWYPSVHRTQAMVADGAIGPLRKIVVRDGHEGPKEIGVSDEFLEWLTDPVQNGGGALIDFGCYGANLITWLMDGQRPTSVFAVTQTIKPEIYEDVDDEATIVLTYPEAQGIIQASWNWPFSRKDMSVYGKTGYIHADNNVNLRVRLDDGDPERQVEAERMADQFDDPFSYLAAVVQGRTRPVDDLSSLETNMIVVEILDAARRSAESGQTIYLDGRE